MRYSLIALASLLWASSGLAQTNEECLECHSDPEFETEIDGQAVSLYVDPEVFGSSVHKDLDCIMCHADAEVDELPHEEGLGPVHCGECHDDVQLDFDGSIHGRALNAGDRFAPTCATCHGKHDIRPPSDPAAKVYKMVIPRLCGSCHMEGKPVDRFYPIYEHEIVKNYTQSMHGTGLYEKGLIVTATCTDCHGNHTIAPHTDPASSTSPKRVAGTCMKCHALIEQVHQRVIEERLWEEEPGKIPSCTDCHKPHKVNRKQVVVSDVSDQACLTCPETDASHEDEDGRSLTLEQQVRNSIHREVPCVKCHSDIDARLEIRPCEPSGPVNCGSCHAKTADEYSESGHGMAHAGGVEEAPTCTTCHGDHYIRSQIDERSEIFRGKVPELCGRCHQKDGKASMIKGLAEVAAFSDYSKSVHGRSLQRLLPSAVCTDCHTAHHVYRHGDRRSTVNRSNVPATCGKCHRGISKEFLKSVHYQGRPEADGGKEARERPTCTDCHHSHTIAETERDDFTTEVTQQCGGCHGELSETYFDTTHGKAYRLGFLSAAKCSDCHGAHEILSPNDPDSTVSPKNIVGTCRKCHADANTRFTGYLTHATHHDRVKYPILFYTYWAMTGLLIMVFSVFGLHTLLWLPRSFQSFKARRRERQSAKSKYYVRRFAVSQRVTHLFVIVSFLSLALTGMMLKFSGMAWAKFVADLLGGVAVAGYIHRLAAIITFGYFIYHIGALIAVKRRRGLTWRKMIFGENSLMFNRKDARDFGATVKWFVGAGPRPKYGRWTYWEKFDYFAVFWGVAVIGLSGLIKWYPEFFTNFVPGWAVNVASIVHSDEALLAVGFIFTVHFFNTHLRPEAFPMDKVIFTGLVPLEEFKKDRPAEYADLIRHGALGKRIASGSVSARFERVATFFGFLFLGIGITLVGLIVYSVVFGYH